MPPHACGTSVVHQRGLKSCKITPTMFVVWPPPCTGGNKARGVFGQKLDSEDDGEHPGEACRKARWRPTCVWGRPKAIHGVTRPGAWPLRGIPYEGLQRGLGGSLRTSRYLGKNIRVIDGSSHISTFPFCFCIYIVCITPFAVEIATH